MVELAQYEADRRVKNKKDPIWNEKRDAVKDSRIAMDSFNKFSVSIRGSSASVYGILREAGIETQFEDLIASITSPPTDQDTAFQHMRPLGRLGRTSGYTAWMYTYAMEAGGSKEN